jgi:hypothetical protein
MGSIAIDGSGEYPTLKTSGELLKLVRDAARQHSSFEVPLANGEVLIVNMGAAARIWVGTYEGGPPDHEPKTSSI